MLRGRIQNCIAIDLSHVRFFTLKLILSGVVIDFFKPRWELFINEMYDSLKTGIRFNEKAVQNRILNEIETPFTQSNKNYSTKSIGTVIFKKSHSCTFDNPIIFF